MHRLEDRNWKIETGNSSKTKTLVIKITVDKLCTSLVKALQKACKSTLVYAQALSVVVSTCVEGAVSALFVQVNALVSYTANISFSPLLDILYTPFTHGLLFTTTLKERYL